MGVMTGYSQKPQRGDEANQCCRDADENDRRIAVATDEGTSRLWPQGRTQADCCGKQRTEPAGPIAQNARGQGTDYAKQH